MERERMSGWERVCWMRIRLLEVYVGLITRCAGRSLDQTLRLDGTTDESRPFRTHASKDYPSCHIVGHSG